MPSLLAFVLGLFLFRIAGEALQGRAHNSRTVRLGFECLLLVGLAGVPDEWPDQLVSGCFGLIAAIHITRLSHVGKWGFNTGMNTGNLRGAAQRGHGCD